MTAALTAAHAAYQLSTSALQQLGGTPAEHPENPHSIWERWPVVTAGVSCLITTVHAIALAVIGNIPLAVLLSISAVGTGIITAYLWSFSSLQDLDTYVEAFAERVTALSQTALKLSGANKDLTTTRVALEAEAKERTAQFEEKKQEVTALLEKLDHVTDDLQRAEQQAAKMGLILDGSHSVITEMTSKIGDFVTLNKEVSTSSQLLTDQLSSFQSIGDRLGSTVLGLDEENKALLAKKQQAEEMAKGLYSQFMQIAELLVELKKQREALEADLKSLQSVDTSIAHHTSDLHHVAEELDKGATDAQAFVDSLKQYNGIADILKEEMKKASGKP